MEFVGFCGGRKTGEKPSAQGENQQQTYPFMTTGSGDQTRATLVGGEYFHQVLRQPCSPIVSIKQVCKLSVFEKTNGLFDSCKQ